MIPRPSAAQADAHGPIVDAPIHEGRSRELMHGGPPHDRGEAEDRPSGLDPLVLLRLALFRHAWSILALASIGIALGAFLAIIQPNQFESEAKLQLRLGAREQRTPEGAILDEFQRLGSGVVVGDVLQVFSDPMVHRRVVAQVGADTILTPEDPRRFDSDETSVPVRWMHELQAWWLNRAAGEEPPAERAPDEIAARVLQNTLRVTTVFGQNTITIGYTALSPENAQEIVSACIEVFRARHREIYESESQLAFLEEQFESASTETEEARTKLRELRSKHAIVDFTSQLRDLAELVLDLTNLLDSERIELSALKRQLEDLDTRFRGLEPFTPRPGGRITAPNTVYPILVADHRRALEDLEELRAQFPPGSPAYESQAGVIRERLDRLEKQLEVNGPVLDLGEGEATLVENRLYEDIGSRRLELQQQVLNLEGRLVEREAQLERQRVRLEELRDIEFDYRMLESKLLGLETRMSALLPALDRARLLRALETDERLSNLKVIQEPTYPITKAGPNRKKSLMMGLIAGLGLGVAQALARRLLDSRFRYPEELAALQLELLGTIRECRPWQRATRR
jgi:uncharacterized protein involved in exopolysaccharide biosynthesis